jgi:hypothetical protein
VHVVRRRRGIQALALLVAIGLAGCSTPPAPQATVAPTPVPSPAVPLPTPEPEPEPEPVPEPTSPFTGLVQETPAAVLAVKLDNTPSAQPHAGLHKADIVYIEEVEYGITRLAAIFSGAVPKRIGPIRSARITDIDLLKQFQQPAFAFSGAQRKLWPVINAAPMIDVSPNKVISAYVRDRSRRAPYNYFLDGKLALKAAPQASLDGDIGFTFSPEIPAGGEPIRSASVKWSYASAEFVWNEEIGLFEVSMNGRRAMAEEHDRGQNAATVIIQYVQQTPSIYSDKGGGNTPFAKTTGKGTALVLRDGQMWETTWKRPRPKVGTTFTAVDGTVLPFKPGQQWVVLMDAKRPAAIKKPKKINSELESEGVTQP